MSQPQEVAQLAAIDPVMDAVITTHAPKTDILASAGVLAEMPGNSNLSIPSWQPGQKAAAEDGGPKKKKKPRKKTVASRGPTALPANRGTGFEEFFADPPITPDEAREEQGEIYADDLSFEDRIQSCTLRFKSRRRLQNLQSRVFDEYLFLGGLDTNPSPFSGQDPRALKDLTPAERREATRIHTINEAAGEKFYNGDREKWSVDFTGVASGFFSIRFIQLTGFDPDAMNIGISVVENFLRYVLQHDVCPEYEHDVKKALQVCNDAREEWLMLLRLQSTLPGQFNLAAARYFGVHETQDWIIEGDRTWNLDPKLVFFSALVLMNETKLFDQLSEGEHRVTKEFECTLQLKEITRPTAAAIKRFKSFEVSKNALDLNPIGKAHFTPSIIEDDMDHPKLPQPFPQKQMILYFDDNILTNFKPGMKISATICEVDGGLRFVKKMTQIVPTFYTFLPQEMMRFFKPPRENERPAPSINCLEQGGSDDGKEE